MVAFAARGVVYAASGEPEVFPMKLYPWVILLVGLVLFSSAAAQDQKKKKKDKDVGTPATKEEYAQLMKFKELEGKIIRLDSETREFAILADLKRLEPKPGAQAKLNQAQQRLQQQILREQQHLARIRDPYRQMQEYQNFLNRIQQQAGTNFNALFKVVTDRKEFNLQGTDKTIVRLAKLPVVYDEKGNVKEYTEQEKKEKKGKDSKLPGYQAEFANLEVGQVVKITVSSKKPTPKDKGDSPREKKDAEKETKDSADKEKKETTNDKKDSTSKSKEEPISFENPPLVRMIIIQRDAETMPSPGDKKGKKN
jgi:hypothetical protein